MNEKKKAKTGKKKIRNTGSTIMKTNPSKDKKMKELILYLSDRCQDDDKMRAVKLNKLLFYSDFEAYLNFGKPITGQDYFKLPNGPAPVRLKPITEAMRHRNEYAIKECDCHGHMQKRPIALRCPEVSVFDPNEISLVERIIERYKDKKAVDMSNESHKFMGWIIAADKERIPYEIALVSNRDLTPNEIQYGQSLGN